MSAEGEPADKAKDDMEEQKNFDLEEVESDEPIQWPDGPMDWHCAEQTSKNLEDLLHLDAGPEEGESPPIFRFYRQRYEPIGVRFVQKSVKKPVLIDGKVTYSYVAVEISEYLDVQTGLKVPATNRGRLPYDKPINHGEMLMQRQAALHSLRPEVQLFARFVLQFRDQRRGLTPGMATLVTWYAKLHGRRASDVRRLVKPLEAGGICIGDCLFPLFQLVQKKWQRSHYLGELELANYRFARLLAEKEERETARTLQPGDRGQLAILKMTAEEAREYKLAQQYAMRDDSTQLGSKSLRSGVVVPLQHLERPVPSDGCQFNDIGKAIGEPRSSGVPKVMEAQILKFRTTAQSSEHLVERSNTDRENSLAA